MESVIFQQLCIEVVDGIGVEVGKVKSFWTAGFRVGVAISWKARFEVVRKPDFKALFPTHMVRLKSILGLLIHLIVRKSKYGVLRAIHSWDRRNQRFWRGKQQSVDCCSTPSASASCNCRLILCGKKYQATSHPPSLSSVLTIVDVLLTVNPKKRWFTVTRRGKAPKKKQKGSFDHGERQDLDLHTLG